MKRTKSDKDSALAVLGTGFCASSRLRRGARLRRSGDEPTERSLEALVRDQLRLLWTIGGHEWKVAKAPSRKALDHALFRATRIVLRYDPESQAALEVVLEILLVISDREGTNPRV